MEMQKMNQKETVKVAQQSFLHRCYSDIVCSCTGETIDVC